MAFESGLRAALKDAIVARDAAADKVQATKAAFGRIEDEIFDANKRIREARVAAAEEEDERIQAIVAGGVATLLARTNGRVPEADAERDLASLRAARDLLRTALADAETALEWAERKVVRAIGAVLAGSASKLIAEEEELRASLESKRAILRYLRSSLSDDDRRRVDAMLPPSLGWPDAHPAVEPWKTCAEALSKNADATLPDA